MALVLSGVLLAMRRPAGAWLAGLTFAATLGYFLRAFDTETGELLWDARRPAGGQAVPVSYEHEGRRDVVIAAGGHAALRTEIGDSVVPYAPPAP